VQLRHFLQPAAEHRLEGEQRHSEDHAGQEIGGARPERAGWDRARPECAKEQRGTRAHRQELHRQRDQLARAAGRHVLAQEGEAPAEDDDGEHRQVEERNGQLTPGRVTPPAAGLLPRVVASASAGKTTPSAASTNSGSTIEPPGSRARNAADAAQATR